MGLPPERTPSRRDIFERLLDLGGDLGVAGWDVQGTGVYRSVVPVLPGLSLQGPWGGR